MFDAVFLHEHALWLKLALELDHKITWFALGTNSPYYCLQRNKKMTHLQASNRFADAKTPCIWAPEQRLNITRITRKKTIPLSLGYAFGFVRVLLYR